MPSPRSARISTDTGVGLVISLIGIGWTVLALNIPPDPSQASVIGPAVFPVLFGVLLTAGALALVATSMLKARVWRTAVAAAPPPPPAPAEAVPHTTEVGSGGTLRRSFWVLMALLVGYVVLFLPLGYLLSTAIFLMALMTYLNPRRVSVNLLFAALFPVAVYLLFGFALRITLPAGVLSGVLP